MIPLVSVIKKSLLKSQDHCPSILEKCFINGVCMICMKFSSTMVK